MKKNLVIVIISLIMMSCGADVVYTEFKNMPVNGWEAKDVKNYNPIITDTLADYEIQLTVRHTDTYPYQNMWLFVTIEKDTNVVKTDTIECYLANERGEWLGSGLSVKELPLIYEENYKFARSGEYKIKLQQGMREEALKGITDVGVQVVKNKSK
ncbi:MAG: gliding motility lipoprotein GldH [Paludibacteraceae bacterium]|nr:gliding motility lipoprotein GldH [Paludibacteraceae bacterium]